MPDLHYASLYQINTRVWLTELSRQLGRIATLDDIAEADLDILSELGFDWIWFLSVWQTGPAAQAISRTNSQWRIEFEETLPNLKDEDIAGSGFAIQCYTVHHDLGGDAALARLRRRLQARGLKLMLDFVPNHMAPDHPWIHSHPDFFVHGSETDLTHSPQNYCRVQTKQGPLVFAYGRDPYFDGWPDTLQLNYGNPELQQVMISELEGIAERCDGVRCDMAMLILPEVFERTWGVRTDPFWPQAIKSVRRNYPSFRFMAEVYWDLEGTLQQQGFDYTYDKRLYDRLHEGHARSVREHLHAAPDYQTKLSRFLENHDEPRVATSFETLNPRAAAVITYTIPGLRFFHQGQFQGRRKRISPHLIRAPEETPDKNIEEFYNQLLTVLRMPILKSGEWQCLDCQPAWDENGSWDSFICHSWRGIGDERILIAVNYAPHSSQCYLNLPFPEIKNCSVQLKDLLSSALYIREGNNLLEHGLYLDLQPWAYHVFNLEVTA
jgi:glycosidase